ncbi:glycoside hydrolase family 172 protein [Terrimonas alba]|uniref:glycoside hydrolase family 172 protein n=1 Tax=Terrimonas alba TaxID=3349636 RepID=UPI0035F3084F
MIKTILLSFSVCLVLFSSAQQLYEMPNAAESRLSSFENPNGIKGQGGKTNKMAKGNAFEFIKPGETKTLLDIKGQGSIQRIWLTIDQTPVKLRSLRLQFFWDGQSKPAVDVPMGDFFGYNLGKKVAFQSAFFSSGEGRSFNCYIPMPFKKAARILLINEGKEPAKLFYDVDFVFQKMEPHALYFHAYWNRQMTAGLGEDFVVLPKVSGKGRFLGMTVGVNTDSAYSKSWWGEGEVKMYLDGDDQYPTIIGTGTEDYIGSAWGLGEFINQYQGCTVANDSLGQYNFYRWHIPDAIFFNKEIKVTLQQIGGWGKEEVKQLTKKGVNLKPVTVDGPAGFVRLLDLPDTLSIMDEKFPEGWVNFYRVDDYSSVSYFYLDKPSSSLPSLAPVMERIKNVK